MRKIFTVISVVGLGLLAACGSDATTSSESSDSSGSAPITDSARVSEAPGDDTENSAEPSDATSDELVSVAQSGVSTYESAGDTRANMAALIQSNSDEDLFFVEVVFELLGTDGTAFTSEASVIDYLPAGEAVATSVGTMTDLSAVMPVTVEVTASAEEGGGFDTAWAELEVTVDSPDVVVDEEMGFASFSGEITNTSEVEADYYAVDCLVVDADGSVIGGITGYGETIQPGDSATWEASGNFDFQPFADAAGSMSNCRSFIPVG